MLVKGGGNKRDKELKCYLLLLYFVRKSISTTLRLNLKYKLPFTKKDFQLEKNFLKPQIAYIKIV